MTLTFALDLHNVKLKISRSRFISFKTYWQTYRQIHRHTPNWLLYLVH